MDWNAVLLYILQFFSDECEVIELSPLQSAKDILTEIEQWDITVINSRFAIYRFPNISFDEILDELKLVEELIRNDKSIPYLKCLHTETTVQYWKDFFTVGNRMYSPNKVKLAMLSRARSLIALSETAEQQGSIYASYYFARVEKLLALCISILEELHNG